jgi:RNA polymerase sigma factor (sigma-70 family)
MFQTTRWSLILAARNVGADQRAALEQLCRAYRAPVHAFLRRVVSNRDEAEDLTQAFFLTFLEQRFDADAVRERGRFRVYLLATVKHFLANAHDYANAVKRGGRTQTVSLDDNAMDRADPSESPEHTFERVWALTVLERALEQMHREAMEDGKQAMFDRLREFLIEAPEPARYSALADELGMRSNTIAVTVHRLRERLRELVRAELMETVSDPQDVEVELRALRKSLAGS